MSMRSLVGACGFLMACAVVMGCSGARPDRPDVQTADLGDGHIPEDTGGARETGAPADFSNDNGLADVRDDGIEVDAGPLYRVDGSFVLDRWGRVVVLRGVNVATGDLERWNDEQPGADAAAFADIARSGFNAVRLVINWDRIEPIEDQIQSDYLDLVEHHVRLAAAEDLYVVVDMHQDLYGLGFGLHGAPEWSCDASQYAGFEPVEPWFANYFSPEVSACFDHFWLTPELRRHQQEAARQVAARISDVEWVIGFDPFNEPAPGTTSATIFERDVLLPYYEEFAAVIEPDLPGRLYFIEPMASFSTICKTTMAGPLTSFSAVFAPHYYNPSVEIDRLWDGVVGSVRRAVECAADAASGLAAPLAYGELGGDRQTPNLTEYLLALYSVLDEHSAGSFLWIYSKGTEGFGLVDSQTGTWNRHAPAYLRPAPSVVGGQPTRFSWDLDSLHFSFTWQADGVNSTEILLPEWIRAAGYEARLEGQPHDPSLNAAQTRLLIAPGSISARTFELTVAAPYPPEPQARSGRPNARSGAESTDL